MSWRIFWIPLAIVDHVCKIEEFSRLGRRNGEFAQKEDLAVKNLIDAVLDVRDMLKDEKWTEIGEDKREGEKHWQEKPGWYFTKSPIDPPTNTVTAAYQHVYKRRETNERHYYSDSAKDQV